MSKKNIARTAIEGGRASHCRRAEDEEDSRERRAWRLYCKRAALDVRAAEPLAINVGGSWDTGRKNREFDDRLGPVKRWLESQVGRMWNKVMSDVRANFDNRTLAGRHIIDHVEGFVIMPWDRERRMRHYRHTLWPGELYVDRYGFLRQAPQISRRRFYALR